MFLISLLFCDNDSCDFCKNIEDTYFLKLRQLHEIFIYETNILNTRVTFLIKTILYLMCLLKTTDYYFYFFLLMMITGGIHWISGGGDKQAIETARTQVVNAVVGIVILFSLYAIINIISVFFVFFWYLLLFFGNFHNYRGFIN